jgi:hypothetical protein
VVQFDAGNYSSALLDMGRIAIPENPGVFRIVSSYAGTPLVTNDKTGKKRINIPCKTMKQAEQLCRRLNAGEHDGQVYSQR